MEQPLVSIITVNYRNDKVTADMLASIEQANYRNLEVIVVNNACEADNTALFQRAFAGAMVVNIAENLGFAGGNNVGIGLASGKYLYFVNNDTVLLPNSIAPLVARLEQSPKMGAVSPMICYYATPEVVQYAGFTKISAITGRNKALGKGRSASSPQLQKASATAYTHGAAMMVPASVVSAVGAMDESYFLYYEELDWCERMAKAGFMSFYEPAAQILHKESASASSATKAYYQTKNRRRFMEKFRPLHPLFKAYFYLIALPSMLLRNRTMAKAIFKGAFAHQ